ncbi:MAG: site-specific DNA-methyltransferase [Desulfobacterales bacterium]|jgi:adenine-specific DNA-methyltransferase|nr:site-specific DNA-methyltransferase [Desulfobacterales bacterium]
MMSKKQKLELTWIGKENRPKLEPRILLEDPERSYHARHRVLDKDIFNNRLIFGDNLLALKALEHEFAGKVKCVFIDPPYNTGSAFEQYDDGMEHSVWLSLMRDRLEIIQRLVSEDGSLWITIDDNEAHYLKVMCDEIFRRVNFVATCVWEKDKGGRGDADISLSHDNILVYAKNRSTWSLSRNLMPRTETQLSRFKNPDNDPHGPWRQGDDGTAKSGTEKQRFPVTLPSGRVVTPPPGRYWAFAQNTLEKAIVEERAYFGADGNRLPIIKRYLNGVREGVAPRTWWSADDVGTNQQAKRDHLNKLLEGIEPFATPKPEGLLHRIIHIATNPGDLVLDSFAGSGTTGAVAHKMGRRWIMVELGEHCHTHIIPRLKKVIDGEDPGGITKAVNWRGGGGFRYYRLAPSLLEKDKWGNWVVNKTYNAAMLAEALCKLEGFTYAPSDSIYWQHGYSTEQDFIYVTTANLTHDQLQQLSDEVGSGRTLLVLCTAFRARADQYPNLTVKKIPNQVLSRCEWGHDDYSLRVENLPQAPSPKGQLSLFGRSEVS